MPTLSASFEQLKEIATLQEVSGLSERYTVDSAFESLCERLSILDDNFDNLHSLQALVERGETGPALEAFCGKDFKDVFHMEDISMESLTLAGVALVIWCILAIVAIIEFFMMVWSMISGGKGGGGGSKVTVTLKRSAKSILDELLQKSQNELAKMILEGTVMTDAQIDRALSFHSGMTVEGVTIPQDVINDANDRIMESRQRIKTLADDEQGRVTASTSKNIGKEIRTAVQDAYKTLAHLPVRVRGDSDVESEHRDSSAGDIELIRADGSDISIVSSRSIRVWLKKISNFVGSGMSSNITEVVRDLNALKNTVATCIGNLEKAEGYINSGTYSVPPVENINTFWEEKEVRNEYYKEMAGNMAQLIHESVDMAIINTSNNREFTHAKESVLSLYEKNRAFYVDLFSELRSGNRIHEFFHEVAQDVSEKIIAAAPPASIRNAENPATEFVKRMHGVLGSLEDSWKSTLGDTSWTFDTEMAELQSTNAKTKGVLDNIHNEFQTLANNLQISSEKMRKNYPKNPGGFRKICEMIMSKLGNTAMESREYIATTLGFLAGYLRVADNVTKTYTEAMNTALNTLMQGSKSVENEFIRLVVTMMAAAAPAQQQS